MHFSADGIENAIFQDGICLDVKNHFHNGMNSISPSKPNQERFSVFWKPDIRGGMVNFTLFIS